MGGAADNAAAARRRIFEVDEEKALEVLRLHWGDAYEVAVTDGVWTARRPGGGDDDDLTGLTPDELTVKIRADWAREGTL